MDKHAGGVANYRASEGKEVLLDYRGPVDNTLQEILGGVRSACTYVGAHQLRLLLGELTGTLEVEVRKDSLEKLNLPLAKEKLQLRIITNPPDAEVYSADKLLGRSPLTLSYDQPGLYTLRVLKEGFAEVVHAGELVIGVSREVPERFYPLDGASTPQAPVLSDSTEEIVHSVFRYRANGAERDMNPKLVALLAEAAWFFQVPVTLVSGYRPRQFCTRRQSRHIYGAASDVKLDGIPMEVLADFFTIFSDGPYGPMGVGRYPRDGFVHVDSRDETYFWTGNQPSRRRRRR